MNDLVLYDTKAIVEFNDPIIYCKRKTIFKNRDEVKEQLIDICSRALARAWIDERWKQELMADPNCSEREGVYLPKEMGIDYEGASWQQTQN